MKEFTKQPQSVFASLARGPSVDRVRDATGLPRTDKTLIPST